ncbi:hypothetical protein [Scrofimicrobium canadense]|uniref:hypothetical protein n=1 Tax=Scrofimicrobium canadense TaxID=2652290 RepID=UPI0019815C1F|nr:hypothetical protein [Scrofimicrobium canadense]
MKRRSWTARAGGLAAIALAAGLSVPALAPAALASPTGEAPFVVGARQLSNGGGSAGTLDLTQVGNLDWVHITGAQTNRKDIADPIISVEDLNTERATGTLGDSPYTYVWTDGAPTEVGSGTTRGGVFFHNPTEGAPGGYRIEVPASDSLRELRVIGGIWNATGELTIQSGPDAEPSYRELLTAGGSPIVRDYTVLISPGEGLVFTSNAATGATIDGNVSLAAVALSEIGADDGEFGITAFDAPPTINLTELGAIDWLHLDGMSTDRKIDGGETITISNRSPLPIDPIAAADHPVAFSWSDGTPTESAYDVRTGGVFSVRGTNDGDPRGFDLGFTASNETRTVNFVASSWNADVELSLFLDGSDTAADVDYSLKSRNNVSTAKLFVVELPAGLSARLEGQIVTANHDYANVALAGIAVSGPDASDSRAELESLLDDAKNITPLEASEQMYAQLAAAVNQTETLLAGDPSSAQIEAQLRVLQLAYDAALGSAPYAFTTSPGLTSSFGWEGDRHAPITFIDGSYKLRDRGNLMVTFGVPGIPGEIDWYNAEGYLPAFVSEFSKAGMDFKHINFASEATIDGNHFEIEYSRQVVTNNNDTEMKLPVVSAELVPLNAAAEASAIPAGATFTRDWAIAGDRFNGTYAWPSAEQIKAQGTWDDNYQHMADHWNTRLEPLAAINELPSMANEDLINAYKAGFIYTHIIRDDIEGKKQLHVGENGYDELFDHDTIGIVAALFTIGDFTYAQDYLETLPAHLQYDDAKWKYSWPFALYLQRAGDDEDAEAFVRERFEVIKANTHKIETDRQLSPDGFNIMKETSAIDSRGLWTIDNWSALAGLSTYAYIADRLGEVEEVDWATEQYDSLMAAANGQLEKTVTDNDLSYIPMSMVEANEDGPRSDPRDANWASMFLFGRWGWDGYLFGAEQSGLMVDWIDQTYGYGADRRVDAGASDNPYNFGGYPHGYFSSAYNAGYGSTALRGEAYRDAGIRGYEFMINESQSSPFGWWEGIGYPNENSPWSREHAAGGGGSNQHMWGQSTATKVLFDSLFALKSDGTAIIGRGVPVEWVADGEAIDVSNYPVNDGGRVGYKLSTSGDEIHVDFFGDTDKLENFSIELMVLRDNIASVNVAGAEIDREAGIVGVPSSTESVVITMGEEPVPPPELTEVTAEAPTRDGNRVTIPVVEGVVYADADGNAYGREVDIPEGGSLKVFASAADGYKLADGDTTWEFAHDPSSPVDPEGSQSGPQSGSTAPAGAAANSDDLATTGFGSTMVAIMAALLLGIGAVTIRRSALMR